MIRLVAAALLLGAAAQAAESPLHKVGDDRIRQAMIQQSATGSCACPWSPGPHHRECGHRSRYVWSRKAARPLCYATDIPDAMINAWRDRHDVHPPVP